jgi:hypothetical protein
MRTNYSILIILAFLTIQIGINCRFRKGDELTKFNKFEFSHRNPTMAKYYSILFTQVDTMFVKKYTLSGRDSLFYAIFPTSDRSILNEFVRLTDSLPLDSLEDMNSGEERSSIYLDYGNERHSLYIHSLNPPKVLDKFNNWINKLMASQLIQIYKYIAFKDDDIIHEVIRINRR